MMILWYLMHVGSHIMNQPIMTWHLGMSTHQIWC